MSATTSSEGGEKPARYPEMSVATKAKCLEWARLGEELKREPGGTPFQTDMLLAIASKAGLTVVDKQAHEGLLAALKDVTRILDAVTYTAGLGKGQRERLEKAKAAIRLAETGARS